MKRLFILVLIAATILSGFMTVTKPLTDIHNGFMRKALPVKVSQTGLLNVKNARIAGIWGAGKLYFYHSNPHKLYSAEAGFTKLDSLCLRFDTAMDNRVKRFYSMTIEHDDIALLASNYARILHFDLATGNSSSIQLAEKFTKCVPISPTTYVSRSSDAAMRNQRLTRENIITAARIIEEPQAKRLNDGGINDDGILLYDSLRHHIVYVHYYHSDIRILDTNLKELPKRYTIDSFHARPISTAQGKNGITNTSPERILNRHAALFNDHLLILSKLKADNESNNYFKEHSAIDLYDLTTGLYQGSFYIPAHNGELALEFAAYGDLFAIAYPSYLISYHIMGL